MKKIITIICSILLTLSLSSVIYAEDGEITITSASGNNDSVSVSGKVDKDITAVVIEVVDKSGQILSMQTVEVVDKTFSCNNIYVDLNVGNTYTVKVADFDGGDWAKKDFTVENPYHPIDDDDDDDDKPSKKDETLVPTQTVIAYHASTSNKIEVTPVIKEFSAEEYANVTEPTVLVSNYTAIDKLAKDIVDDLSVLTKNSKLPDYISEISEGAIYKAIAAGKKFTIEVEANIITSQDAKEDADKIENYVNEIAKDVNGNVQLFLDLNVNLLANNQKVAYINELDYEIEFAIALDETTLKNFENKCIYIACLHDDTSYVEATLEGNIIYFKTNRFSTFGVFTTDSKILTEKPVEENKAVEEEIDIEEKTSFGLYIALGAAVVVAAIIIIVIASRKSE